MLELAEPLNLSWPLEHVGRAGEVEGLLLLLVGLVASGRLLLNPSWPLEHVGRVGEVEGLLLLQAVVVRLKLGTIRS